MERLYIWYFMFIFLISISLSHLNDETMSYNSDGSCSKDSLIASILVKFLDMVGVLTCLGGITVEVLLLCSR